MLEKRLETPEKQGFVNTRKQLGGEARGASWGIAHRQPFDFLLYQSPLPFQQDKFEWRGVFEKLSDDENGEVDLPRGNGDIHLAPAVLEKRRLNR
ncbi:MAG: hypothetical protein FJ126_12720, partial [Deltaproteobacteria bacterium]|nr:hypothetical protein [Deltaproteobacteria bacterium]